MTIDPRLIDRRREVAEDRARRNIARLLKFLALLAVVGAVVWVFLSPYLSVGTVKAVGIKQSSAPEILEQEGVVPGTPMVLVRGSAVERLLEKDPWVADATVELHWPRSIVVKIDERVPAAWVKTAGGWSRRAVDGVALPSTTAPDSSLGWVELPDVAPERAERSSEMLGAVEFVAALPHGLQSSTLVTLQEGGELWAIVDGYEIRLGRPVEMTAKAISLVAMLNQRPERSSIITLIAPTHPALTPKQTAGNAKNSHETVDPDEDGGE